MGIRKIQCALHRLTHKSSVSPICIAIKTKRQLTAGEIKMAQKVFQSSINYTSVYIHNEEFLPLGLQNDNTVMTPNGEMYFPKGLYKSDFSSEPDNLKHLFIHEMVHVWQHELGYSVAFKGMLLHPFCKLIGRNPYLYVLDPKSMLSDYNMEQQGDIIADYFILFAKLNSSACSVSSIPYVISDYQSVLANFLRNPSDVNNLP